MPVGTGRRFFHRVFESRPRCLKELLRILRVTLREQDAPFQKTFSRGTSICIRKFGERRRIENAFRARIIALNHRDIPFDRGNGTIWIGSRWNFVRDLFQKSRVAFPPKIDVATLNLSNERGWCHRSHALGGTGGVRPPAHGGIGKENIPRNVRILRVEFLGCFECVEGFLPMTLPPLDRSD